MLTSSRIHVSIWVQAKLMAGYVKCQYIHSLIRCRARNSNRSVAVVIEGVEPYSSDIKCDQTRSPSHRPSCEHLSVALLTGSDWISSQAIGRDALRDALMSDIRRLIYSLGLHMPNPPGTPSSIEMELGRRLFWEAYACDK